MPLILELIRHADALPRDPGGSDRDRLLSSIGRRQARMLAERRQARGQYPQRVWCSPAKRARETLDAFGFDFTSVAVEEATIYEAELDTLLDLVAQIQALADHAVIVGHNPGLQDLVGYLVGPRAPEMLTGTHVSLELPKQPRRPLRGSGRLREYWTP